MTNTAMATDIKPQSSASDISQTLEAKLPDGRTIEVVIPGSLCIKVTNATQSFLIQSMAIAQKTGGIAQLAVSKVGYHYRGNDHSLVLQTDNLGAILFDLTPTQWREVAKIAQQAQSGSQIH